MAQFQETYTNLLAQYEGFFDVRPDHCFAGKNILAYAFFNQRTEKYVLVKRAQLFAIDVYEHVFFVHIPHLDKCAWEEEKARIIEAEKEYVTPHANHMYSYITLVLLCESIEEDVKKEIRRLRYTKNYKFTIHGYSTVRVAAIELSSEHVFHNSQGKELKKVMYQALHM